MGEADTKCGLQPKVAGLLCYLLGWLTGIVFLIIKDDKFVRFHALQSIITFGSLTVISYLLSLLMLFVLGIFWAPLIFLLRIIELLGVVLWVLLMVKAYRGEKFKLPWIGDIAEKNS